MELKQMIALDSAQGFFVMLLLFIAFVSTEALLLDVVCCVTDSPHGRAPIVLWAMLVAMIAVILVFCAHAVFPVGDGSISRGMAIGDIGDVAYRSETVTAKSGEKQLVCVYTSSDDETHRNVMSELSSRLGSSVTWIESNSDIGKDITSAADASVEPFIAVVSLHQGLTGVSYDVSDRSTTCPTAREGMTVGVCEQTMFRVLPRDSRCSCLMAAKYATIIMFMARYGSL